MTIFLFSTTDMFGHRQHELEKLLHSISESAHSVPDVKSYLLLQNCSPEDLSEVAAKAPAACSIIAVPGRLPLSVARNRMLEAMWSANRLDSNDVVGFPDDDCWLPKSFLSCLKALFLAKEDLDVLICRVSLDPDLRPFGLADVAAATVPQLVRLSSSNCMFLRGSLVEQVGMFDPKLGVGTENGSGEDTDYVIRAALNASYVGFIDRPLVGHPVADRASAAKYFRGTLVVLSRHAFQRPALLREFLRKLLVGIYFMGHRAITPAVYLQALVAATKLRFQRGSTSPAMKTFS